MVMADELRPAVSHRSVRGEQPGRINLKKARRIGGDISDGFDRNDAIRRTEHQPADFYWRRRCLPLQIIDQGA